MTSNQNQYLVWSANLMVCKYYQ